MSSCCSRSLHVVNLVKMAHGWLKKAMLVFKSCKIEIIHLVMLKGIQTV